jgi:hypothetical protein
MTREAEAAHSNQQLGSDGKYHYTTCYVYDNF